MSPKLFITPFCLVLELHLFVVPVGSGAGNLPRLVPAGSAAGRPLGNGSTICRMSPLQLVRPYIIVVSV